MPIISDDERKRRYVPRPSRRVDNPMRTYTFKLGGKQADWLDAFIGRSEKSTSEVLRYLISLVIRKKSGIQLDMSASPEVLDVQALKAEIANDVRDSLHDEFKRYIAELLKDQTRAPMMHTLTSQAVEGGEISDAEIDNMLEGFSYD